MKNNLGELNNYLFEEMERLNDDEELNSNDSLEREIKRAHALTGIATAITKNASVILQAKKHFDEMGTPAEEMPKMLTADE